MAEQAIINTFSGGLNQDVDFILQPDGTYRNMKNGMLISMDGHSYTVEISQGNNVINTLPAIFKEYDPRNSNITFDKEPMPIGFISFIDDLVVFSSSDESTTGGFGEIGLLRFKKVQNGFTSTYTPLYCHQDLKFTKHHKIEGFSFRENDNIQRVYWTDNNSEPKVMNIADPIFTTYVGPFDIPTYVGAKFMVLSGAINYGGQVYGPCDGSGVEITTNIFESNGLDFAYTVLTSSATVIYYYPIELFDWTPSRSLGNIQFSEYGGGSKKYGSSMYFYRLYSTAAATYTTWSYPSSPIHVGGDNSADYLTGVPGLDFVGAGTETTLATSNKSIKLKISNLDRNFDTIEVCCIEYNQKQDIPYVIKIVSSTTILSTEMIIEDNGVTNLGTVTINELTLFPANILKVKTITTDKNYNLIANTTEREEFDLDLSGITLSPFQYPLLTFGSINEIPTAGTITTIPNPTVPYSVSNPGTGLLMPNNRFLVSDAPDASNRVEYPVSSGIYYYTGDVITAVALATTATFTGTATMLPCTTKNRYTSIATGKRVEDAIPLTTAFTDYRDPTIAFHNKGYWSTEKYRIGLMFYDKKGNPFYVKHIDDITFPRVPDKGVINFGGLMIKDYYDTDYVYSLNPSAINLDGLDIPESIMDRVSGFSIVRAERDPLVLAQGLLMQTVINELTTPNQIMPLNITRTDISANPTLYTPLGDLCSCICPDWLIGQTSNNKELLNSIGIVGQKIKEAFWLDGSELRMYSSGKNFATRLFDNVVPDNTPGNERVMTLQNMNGEGSRGFPEEAGDVNIIGDGKDYYNKRSPISTTAINSYTGSTYTFLNPLTIGSKKLVILPNHFSHYGPAGEYNSWAERFDYNKIAVNFLSGTQPEAQYGGDSDSAIANTLYISTGHFQPITASVKADTLNGTFSTGPYAGENKYTFNNIEIFGGDCFTCLVDHGFGLYDSGYDATENAYSYSMWFPMECNSNYNLRRGLKVSNKGMFPGGLMAWDDGTPPNVWLEGYSYNKGYSSTGTIIKYPALPVDNMFTGKFEYRTRFAGIKYPGETIDTFRKFLINDYKDLDGQSGEINNIRAKDGRVLVWQNHALSSVPILERQLLAATSGAATVIGTGGVVDRFDPINSYFGNQHQHGLTKTEYGFIWFDMRNRALCVMDMSNGLQEISLSKGLQAFFNNEFNEGDATTLTPTDIYNTNDYAKPELPLMGYGIVGVYDPRYKMSYLTFKYADDLLLNYEDEIVSITAKDFTVGYSHVLNAIVGFYDFTPGIIHNHNDLVVSANNSKNYVYYGAGMPETTFNVGDVIKVVDPENLLDGEYVCLAPVTIDTFPPTNPALDPLTDTTHWVLINKESQIYVQTFNSQYCKFYGKVYDHEIEIIVNPKTDGAVSFLNIQQKANDLNYTSVYCSTDDQTASDVNISATNRAYKYIDKSWFSSLPLSAKGRLTDNYLKIKFVLKNYITNPTIAKNKNKILQFLQTWMVGKR